MQTLSYLLGDFTPPQLQKLAGDTEISGLSSDSRSILPGSLFFAVPGVHVDGHKFIPQVIQAGAKAIVHERELEPAVINLAKDMDVILVRVAEVRRVLSRSAAAWHDFPGDSMTVIGVTGTDGKSSTVFFIHQILEAAGMASGFFSTVALQDGSNIVPNNLRQSTPEALELHEVLARFRANGKSCAVIESTSHGLSYQTQRLRDISFQGAVFTNLSHEHLEFHGSYEQYRSDKANLFRDLKPGKRPDAPIPFGIINQGDVEATYFREACPYRVFSYASALSGALPEQCSLYADEIVGNPDHCLFKLHFDPECISNGQQRLKGKAGIAIVRIPLPGTFNIENVMAAMLAVACILDCSPIDLLPYLDKLQGVKGRMVPVHAGQDFTVIIDYAHTPGAFSKVLPMFRLSTKGRLIAVFGSGGERDIEKRPMQGRLAARYCDELVLTNEDPRLEDPMSIITQIRDGALAENPSMDLHCIVDRQAAIDFACHLAKPGDTVILLGKGHEQSIFLSDGKHAWDEETAALNALAALGYQV